MAAGTMSRWEPLPHEANLFHEIYVDETSQNDHHFLGRVLIKHTVRHVRSAPAGSTGRRNTGVESLCWGFKLQGLTWMLRRMAMRPNSTLDCHCGAKADRYLE